MIRLENLTQACVGIVIQPLLQWKNVTQDQFVSRINLLDPLAQPTYIATGVINPLYSFVYSEKLSLL